ncbi:MAG: hypothetical protein ACM3XO_08275 [Bacteroidota bacterium]
MSKDIFILARQMAGKQDPIVSALLYQFCPAAAHWYLRNVQPEDVFDVVWRALEDYESGRSMAVCLEAYGLASLIPSVKSYIEQVTLFRSRYSAAGDSPELLPLFKGDRPSQSTFGLQNELNNLGGSWRSLVTYVRVWAFLLKDWKAQMKIPMGNQVVRTFRKFNVSLSVPGDSSSSEVQFPVWGWDVMIGKVRSIYLGLLVSRQMQDALRFALVNNSDLVGNKGWPGQRPYLFGLDRNLGTAEHINLSVEQKDILSMIVPMYETARTGSNFPLSVLRNREACLSCGYRKMCFGDKGNVLLSAVIQQLIHGNKRE